MGKMGSVSKALATGLVLNREQTDDKKIRIRYCRGDDGLDGRQKRELDDEAKRVARKIHHVTKRMDEEEQVKDRIRCKQQEETFAKRCKQDEKRKQEMTRAEKNKEWRMKKEKEGVDVNWRKVRKECEENYAVPVANGTWLLLGKYTSVVMDTWCVKSVGTGLILKFVLCAKSLLQEETSQWKKYPLYSSMAL